MTSLVTSPQKSDAGAAAPTADLVDRIERNRFVGREFLLWLWFESDVFETNLSSTQGDGCSLWIETRMSLAFEREEAVLKSVSPATIPEAREALRQGKLPKEARIRMVSGELEFAWAFKADTLGLASLSIPAQLKKKEDESHEILYERMRLTEALEATLEALYSDFLSLRLAAEWGDVVVPALRRFAAGKKIDERAYLEAKQRVVGKRRRSR